MPKKEPKEILRDGGVFQDIGDRFRLILRLMGDARVSPMLKLLPMGTILYLIIPDLAPGPIDDALIIWLGGYLFIELCPPDVVQEHMEIIRLRSANGFSDVDDEDIIEGEARDL